MVVRNCRERFAGSKKYDEVKGLCSCVVFLHLVLEKLLKPHWIKDNEGNHPPKIHNLQFLCSKTRLQLQKSDIDFLGQMNAFQLEGRNPEFNPDFAMEV